MTLSTDTNVFGDGHINVKNVRGTIEGIYSHKEWKYLPLSYFHETDIALEYTYGEGLSALTAGASDTPVSCDDYTLATPFTTNDAIQISGSAVLGDYTYDESSNTFSRTYQRAFMAKKDIVIKEIGITTRAYKASNGAWNYPVLIYRKVLDAPIEVPANANFILSFSTTISANPNKPADYNASAALVE
jgi:hypothetical protein